MPRSHVAAAMLSLAPWIVAGSLFLGASAPVSAQDASSVPLEVTTKTFTVSADLPEQAVGGVNAPSAMPSAGVGAGLEADGTGPLSLGALVGAGVAAIYALRERWKNR